MLKAQQRLAGQLSTESEAASISVLLQLSHPPSKAELNFAKLFSSLNCSVDEKRKGLRDFQDRIISVDFLRQLFVFLTEGNTEEGLRVIKEILGYHFSSRDDAISIFFKTSFEGCCLEEAVSVNRQRKRYLALEQREDFCIVIQCFAKNDTLSIVFDSLLANTSNIDCNLVIIQDSPINAKGEQKYIEGHKNVKNLIEDTLPDLFRKFSGISVIRNNENLGTAITCVKSIDAAVQQHENFLFLEDDCILAPDAINFFAAAAKIISIDSDIWFASCESPFFNAADRPISAETFKKVTQIAENYELDKLFTLKDFVPSTCFISNSKIWEKVRDYRCMPRGPESLSKQLKKWQKQTLLPAIPRASDVGMNHPLGYSTTKKGEGNVKEQKNVLAFSKKDISIAVELQQIDRKFGSLLYQATSLLKDDAIEFLLKKNSIFDLQKSIGKGGSVS